MDIEKYLHVMPKLKYIPDFDPKPATGWQGIKALWYQGAPYHDKRTKVFAYIGYPERTEKERVPAVVLVHGGDGHAFAHWIRLWNERGYAAIAMDTEGYFPAEAYQGLVGTEGEDRKCYVRELYGELAEEGYTVGPENDNVSTSDLPVEEQWLYHGIVDTVLAHNILKEDPRIDREKIGICGISWGSVITTLAIGYDTEYAFAIPIYGSAYLEYAATLVGIRFQNKRTRQLWSAADRLSKVHFPVLWLCALYDAGFCSYSNSCSYLDTREWGGVLSIQERLLHSHGSAWDCEEAYYFADRVLEGKEPMVISETREELTGGNFRVKIPEKCEGVLVRLLYSTEEFSFDEECRPINQCKTAAATLNGNMVSASIPKEAYRYYFEFTMKVNGKCLISTTEWIKNEESHCCAGL